MKHFCYQDVYCRPLITPKMMKKKSLQWQCAALVGNQLLSAVLTGKNYIHHWWCAHQTI